MSRRTEVFPVGSSHPRLEVGGTRADSKKIAARLQYFADFAEGGVEVVDVFENVERDDKVEAVVVEFLGLDIAETRIETERLGVGDPGLTKVEANGFVAGIVANVFQEIALPAADFEQLDFFVFGEIAFDPVLENLVFNISSQTAFGFEDFVLGIGTRVSAGEKFLSWEIPGINKTALAAFNDIVAVFVVPEVMLGAFADRTSFEDTVILEFHRRLAVVFFFSFIRCPNP